MKKNFSCLNGIVAITLSLTLFRVNAAPNFFDFSPDTTTTKPLFLDPLAARHNDLEKKQNALIELRKRSEEENANLARKLNQINTLLSEAEASIPRLSGKLKEYASKKISKLNEQKQIVTNIQESLTRSEEILQAHIKLLQEMVEEIKNKPLPIEKKLVYNLADERLIQSKIAELSDKAISERYKLEGFQKQRKSEEDTLAIIVKDIDIHNKEQKKLLSKASQIEGDTQLFLKQARELIELTSNVLADQKYLTERILERLDLEISYKKDEISYLEMRLEAYKKSYNLIDVRLFIDKSDFATAQEELERERVLVIENKNKLTKIRNQKRAEKERLKLQLNLLDQRVKQIKAAGENDLPIGQLAIATFQRLEHNLIILDQETDLLGIKKDLEDERLNIKALQVRIIEIRYQLQTKMVEKTDIQKWVNEFSKGLKKEETDIGALKEKYALTSTRLTEGRRLSELMQQRLNEVKEQKDTVFKDELATFNELLTSVSEIRALLEKEMQLDQEEFLVCSEIIRYKNDIIKYYKAIIFQLETKKRFDIWKRSPRAIPLEGFNQALLDAEDFIKDFFWRLPDTIKPLAFVNAFTRYSLYDYIGIFLFLLFFILVYNVGKGFMLLFGRFLTVKCSVYTEGRAYVTCRVLTTLLEDFQINYPYIFTWAFLQLDIIYGFKDYFGPFSHFSWFVDSPYLVACFYIFSIPVLVIIAKRFIQTFDQLIQELDLMFFARELQTHYMALLQVAVYSTIVLVQFRQAFLAYARIESYVPMVVFAAYSLILQLTAVFLLLIHKDDILAFFNPKGRVLTWVKEVVASRYRPVLVFLTVLLVLSNPYIGYSNLAFLLSYAVPLSLLILYLLLTVHAAIRKHSSFWFVTEVDGEFDERFEHAKAYYGMFVILTFLALLFISFVLVARIWGASASVDMLYDLFQRQWTVDIGNGYRFGVIQFLIISLFVAGGFLFSSLMERFVWSKVFDILRLDFGLRNTLSSIIHYLIVFFSIILGFSAVKLGSLILWASGGVLLAVGFGARDLISDVIAGVLVLLERSIEVGSFIQVDDVPTYFSHGHGVLGTVYKISARSTTLRTVNNHFVVIPNKDLIAKPIVNWGYGRSAVGFELTFCIEYDSNVREAAAIISRVITNEPRILRSPAPNIRIDGIDERGLHFFVRAFISTRRVREQWDIASELRMALLTTLEEHSIYIAYPHTIVHPHKVIKRSKDAHSVDEEAMNFKFDIEPPK